MASRQASTPSRCAARSAMPQSMWHSRGAAVGVASAAASHCGIGAPERLSYHQWPSRSRRSTQSVQPPAASGNPVGPRRRRRGRDRTGSRSSRRPPRAARASATPATANTSSACTGAHRQARRDHRQRAEPVAGQRGRRRQTEPAGGVTHGAQHPGCVAKVAEPVDSHRPSLSERRRFAPRCPGAQPRLMSRAVASAASFSGLRIT